MDQDELRAFALRVWGYKQGEMVSFMVHVGDELGLYRAMDGKGPMTAAALASATQLDERWLLEWLRCQGAAGLLATEDGEHFELSVEGAEVLAHEDNSVWFAAGAFRGGVAPPDVVPRLLDAFRTGTGLSYDDLGPNAAHAIERLTAPWTRLVLVPRILPSLRGVTERLEHGGRAADVGCGGGVALEAMARRFPTARFDGYDPSRHALDRARARMGAAGIENVTLLCAGAEDLATEPTYDLVVTLDCLHDLPAPEAAVRAIRAAIRPDGVWLVKDIRCSPSWRDNLKNPVLAFLYGTSITACMSSGLSEPGGAGLGTLGLHPGLLERYCADAGFSSFRVHDFDDPANLYYEVRP